MRRYIWVLALAMGSPFASGAAVDKAATAKEVGADSVMPSTDAVAKDYLRAASPEASPLGRLILARALQFLGAPGMPPSSIPPAKWQAIRDGAVRDGKDDPMVQAVFLMGDSPAQGDPSTRDHAVDLLTRHLDRNGQLGLILLSLPEVAGEGRPEREIWTRRDRASEFDSTYTAVQHALAVDLAGMRWTRALNESPAESAVPDETRSAIFASALAAVGALSQMGPAFKLCKLEDAAIRRDCQLLGQRLFEEAETAIDIMMSLRLIELTTTDEAVRRQVINERRRFEWQSEQLGTIWADGKVDSPAIRRHLERQRQLTELEAMQETLISLNLPMEPPATWRSNSERFATPAKKAASASPQ